MICAEFGIGALDQDVVDGTLIKHAESEVRLLRAPLSPESAEMFTSDIMKAILVELRDHFDYVVVDTGSAFGEATLTVLEVADLILTITTLEVTSIHRVGPVLPACRACWASRSRRRSLSATASSSTMASARRRSRHSLAAISSRRSPKTKSLRSLRSIAVCRSLSQRNQRRCRKRFRRSPVVPSKCWSRPQRSIAEPPLATPAPVGASASSYARSLLPHTLLELTRPRVCSSGG